MAQPTTPPLFIHRYGDGTVRVTVEENIIFPFVPHDRVEDMLKEPIFEKYEKRRVCE